MQDPRGTSLSDDARVSPRPANPAPATRPTLLFGTVALVAYLVDIGTKVLAVDRLVPGVDVPVIGNLLVLHLLRNPGAAFSTGTQFTLVFTGIAIVALLVVLNLSRRLGDRVWAVALGLLLAGVAGNLTDRIFREPGPLRGHVIDFLMLPHWPVFNVADMCINTAAGLILLQAFRGIRLTGQRDGASDEQPPGSPS